ncbi:MAG: hypothetical protein WCK15_11765 [Pirellula sp.]
MAIHNASNGKSDGRPTRCVLVSVHYGETTCFLVRFNIENEFEWTIIPLLRG